MNQNQFQNQNKSKANPLLMKLGKIGGSPTPQPTNLNGPLSRFEQNPQFNGEVDQRQARVPPMKQTQTMNQNIFQPQSQKMPIPQQNQTFSTNNYNPQNFLASSGNLSDRTYQGNMLNNVPKSFIMDNSLDDVKTINHHYVLTPIVPIQFGSNVWENYKMLTNEIKRKDHKIQEVKQMLDNSKISNDQNEIRQLQTTLNSVRNDLMKLQSDKKNLESIKNSLIQQSKTLDGNIQQRKNGLEREKILSKSTQELNYMLNSLKNQFNSLQATKVKMDYEAKIQLDRESRVTMEEKLYQICMEASKNNPNPKVQELYAKLLASENKV